MRRPAWWRRARLVIAVGASTAVAVVAGFMVQGMVRHTRDSAAHHFSRQTNPGSYIGLYCQGAPSSYAGVTAFTTATGVEPSLVSYYSGWLEPFRVGFAETAASHGAMPLVQMDPADVNLTAIATGQYDSYLTAYAETVRAYGHPVILSFGHEMNGYWYSWGYQHASPTVFVAVWRHIVDLFRSLRARNVIWMWTVNTVHTRANVPSPGPWWPGSSYVNWVGIDGYYFNKHSSFASLFGPTIADVRTITRAPILIAETAAPPTNQPTKIAELFAGIRLYGLLGFVWFDAVHVDDWRLTRPAAAAFRRGVLALHRPEPS